MFPECVFFAVGERFGRILFPDGQFPSVGNILAGICSRSGNFLLLGNAVAGFCSRSGNFSRLGNVLAGICSRSGNFLRAGNIFAGICSRGDHSRRGSIPAEGLPFVCRYKSVAGNLFFIPAVFFPYRGDELARVVDPESHVCDRQSFLYVVGLVEGAD